MQFDRHKVYPHPVLRPFSDDYVESEFQSAVDFVVSEDAITMKIEHALSCEQIHDQVEKGKAAFVTCVSCRDTYVEHVLTSHKLNMSDSYDIGEFKGEVRVNSFIIAVNEISSFTCEDINEEFGKGPFSFSKGQILAEEESQVFFIDRDMFKPISAVFDWVKKDDQADGVWTIGFDSDHVQIQVSPKTKELVDNARNTRENRVILINSIYFAAVMEAVTKLKHEDSRSTFSDKKWAQVLLSKIHNSDIDLNSNDSYLIAESLMQNPMSQLNHYIFGK